MSHEDTPNSLPLPEITQDHKHPPQLLDLEIRPEALLELMSQLGERRTAKVDQILIRGGLVEYVGPKNTAYDAKFRFFTTGLENPMINTKLLAALLSQETTWSPGFYNPLKKSISLHPDSSFFLGIAESALQHEEDAQEKRTIANILNTIRERTTEIACLNLIEELDHSTRSKYHNLFPLLHQLGILPLLVKYLEIKADEAKAQIHFVDLADQALSLRSLISDEDTIHLYRVARVIAKTIEAAEISTKQSPHK